MDERFSTRLQAAMSDAGRGVPRGGDPRAPSGEPGRADPARSDPRTMPGDLRGRPGDPRAMPGDPRAAPPPGGRGPGLGPGDPGGPLPTDPMAGPPRGMPPRSDPRGAPSSRGLLYARKPATWRRAAALVVGLVLLALAAYWLELVQALVLWVLFSVFVLLWPNFPPTTSGEERAQAWPFEP
ncbi:MAG TPA: hypothetical protein VFE37_27845 [Chloroflexota bacterium]|nr:hypothetical protein [Chloroflexota bacterium]